MIDHSVPKVKRIQSHFPYKNGDKDFFLKLSHLIDVMMTCKKNKLLLLFRRDQNQVIVLSKENATRLTSPKRTENHLYRYGNSEKTKYIYEQLLI